MARKKGINTYKLTLSVNKELYLKCKDYIDNFSYFMNSCLKNFIKKNQSLIDSDDNKISKYLVDLELNDDDLPNIKYIMNNLPIQLSLFPFVGNKIIGRKKKVITYPCSEDLVFLSNNSLKLIDKVYYFEINNKLEKPTLINDSTTFDDDDKWW